MRIHGIKIKPQPSSDLQSRLAHIQEQMDEMHRELASSTGEGFSLGEAKEKLTTIAYAIGYLARIVIKHVQTGET